MSSAPPINIIVSLLCKANQKIDELNDRCAGLEKKCDYWKGEYEKYSRIGNVAMKYIICQDCLDQNTHEGQTVEICETCTDKLKTLHNAKAEVEYWKNQMQEESERADHWHKCYNDKRTKYLTLVEKIQCEGCKLNKYDYNKYCSECIKSREKSKKEIEYWQKGYEELLEKYYQTPRDEVDHGSRSDDAGRVAAETHLLLQDKTIPDAIVNARVKKLRRERQRLTKRLREVPGVTSLAGGQPPPDVEEDEYSEKTRSSGRYAFQVYKIRDSYTFHIHKTRESYTWSFWYKKRKATGFHAVLEELKESGAKPKKKRTPTQTPIISREKTPREELLESVWKSAERLAKAREDIERIREKRKETKHKTEAERLKPLPGWEDLAAGRKQRRRLEYDEEKD
ncbi:hypothetical protein OS493_020171 [Desmophyllum pertusum]|uniref:Uncharacterized protein n=1 Tax=Desmophyllum pertusum TaxID=174260 RepID=A0A9X0A0J7_9CNID|nr:hypothetical protein OS493_020171 [Desmophyllum pertusum]